MNTLTVLTPAGGFSGTGRPLVQHLGSRWRVLLREVPPVSGPRRATDLALMVPLPLRTWKRRLPSRQFRRPQRVADFASWTRAAPRLVPSCLSESDAVLQISSLLAVDTPPLPLPYVLCLDLTTAQPMRLYPPSSPLDSEREAWLALEREVYHRASRLLVANTAAAGALRADDGVPGERIAAVGTGSVPAADPPAPATRKRTIPAAGRGLLGNAAVWRTRSDRCRRLVRARHSWAVVAGRIDRELWRALSGPQRTAGTHRGVEGAE